MQTKKTLYWIWLSMACDGASSKTDRLCEHYQFDPEAIYCATREDYAAFGFVGVILEALCNKSLTQADQVQKLCAHKQIRILTQDTDAYPVPLRRIMSRPILLYVAGELPPCDAHLCIGMVGTRNMTAYGHDQAYQIAFDLARAGGVVVSGMAKGIDGMSHRGALDAGGKTVAVLGCGVEHCYPATHASLMREIKQNGAVISEYHPTHAPTKYSFPARNRIISALCQGTLVVEADQKSGAMITARYALSQGKDLYALPGNVGELNSVGTNSLIRNGAYSIASAQDILCRYEAMFVSGALVRIPYTEYKAAWSRSEPVSAPHAASPEQTEPPLHETRPKQNRAPSAPTPAPSAPTPAPSVKAVPMPASTSSRSRPALEGKEETVYQKMCSFARPMGVDELSDGSLTYIDIITACTMLEIKGYIEGVPGGLYRVL